MSGQNCTLLYKKGIGHCTFEICCKFGALRPGPEFNFLVYLCAGIRYRDYPSSAMNAWDIFDETKREERSKAWSLIAFLSSFALDPWTNSGSFEVDNQVNQTEWNLWIYGVIFEHKLHETLNCWNRMHTEEMYFIESQWNIFKSD